jgi:AraC family transcriptional regulator
VACIANVLQRDESEPWRTAPPGWGMSRRWVIKHTGGVITLDSEPTPTLTHSSAPIAEYAADALSYQNAHRFKRSRPCRTATVHASMSGQSSRDLAVVAAQLIEAACRARDGDSDRTREHIARAVALLDELPGTKTFVQTIEQVARRIPRGGFARWQSRRLAALVDANLSGKIVIKDLAASLDISVGHFCRAFKRTFGMSAGIWIRNRRIELAQGLMLTTDASLSEIALSCGMNDQSHFTRTFRRIAGETPSAWRQTRHGAIEERITELAFSVRTKPIAFERS